VRDVLGDDLGLAVREYSGLRQRLVEREGNRDDVSNRVDEGDRVSSV
jgi:hypothetical protein